MSKAQLETALMTEVLEEIRQNSAKQTQVIDSVRGLITNDLLLVALETFEADGIIDHDFPAPYGSVAVSNHGSAAVVVSADPPQAGASRGRGSARVDAGKSALFNLHGRALTLYGIAGEQVTVQVSTRPWPPFSSGGGSALGLAFPLALPGQALSSAAAETEVGSAERNRTSMDLRTANTIGFSAQISSVGGAGQLLVLQGSAEQVADPVTWTDLCSVTIDSLGLRVATQTTVPTALKLAYVPLRLVTRNGDTVNSATSGFVTVVVR